MANQLDDYWIEYIESNGTYIKMKKSQSEGFQQEDFQELQVKMIQSNYIPRLVPMTFEDVNNEVSVYYKIEGLRGLRSISKERPPSMQEYYSLFINLVQALQDSNNTMLNDNHFVLNEENIYIGKGYHDVYLMYVPIKQNNSRISVNESLKKLLLNMASEVRGLNGTQFKMILNYLKDPGFSLRGIKQLLSKLQDKQQEEMPVNRSQSEDDSNQEEYKIKKVRSLPPLSSKIKLYSILFGFLAIAVIWKFYTDSPSTVMLITSIILSLLVIAAVVVYWFIWRPGVEPIITEKEVKVKSKQFKQPVQSKTEENTETDHFGLGTEEQDGYQFTEADYNLPQREIAMSTETAVENKVRVDQPQNPTYDETMLLDASEMIPQANKPKVQNFLITNRDGSEERIELNSDNFIIGRAEKGTDFVENGVGVSRMHVEFIRLSDTYGLKDLGAKNGTYVNQEKVIPYKIHELEDEDDIQIGKTVYTYRVVYE
ncbi:DUF6382 domain-containing protein [Oceanobacillus luteolus]|uniref:DUF6382 domain-containing protein n=1 Tax=Oceanobacillus luteolus TaxID=1274358 RepID=A0ABW4HP35_9BACI|nr:DUF6382 domain-containing protein [Oceanobacillus luteolus]MCM3739545.1 DUF6382 domain-containing protein [Oceanobacillus luteolus]